MDEVRIDLRKMGLCSRGSSASTAVFLYGELLFISTNVAYFSRFIYNK